ALRGHVGLTAAHTSTSGSGSGCHSTLPVLTVSASIGDSYGPMGSDGCRGTRLHHSGQRHGGTGGAAGSAEGTGEDLRLRRASSLALARLPARPLLPSRACSPSLRALHRISGDRLRGDDSAAIPLAGPAPLVLGPIGEPAHVRQVCGRTRQTATGASATCSRRPPPPARGG